MTLIVVLTTLGADTGPFNLFSNIGGYVNAMATNVTRAQLLAGYPISDAPDGTTIVRVKSTGKCKNSVDVPVSGSVEVSTQAKEPYIEPTTTTSTSTSTSTSSTTTTTTTYPVMLKTRP